MGLTAWRVSVRQADLDDCREVGCCCQLQLQAGARLHPGISSAWRGRQEGQSAPSMSTMCIHLLNLSLPRPRLQRTQRGTTRVHSADQKPTRLRALPCSTATAGHDVHPAHM